MKKFLSFILTLCLVFTLGGLIQSSTVNAATGDTYARVINMNDLKPGDTVTFVAKDQEYAMGSRSGKMRKSVAVIGKFPLSYVDGLAEFTLEEGTLPGTFAFKENNQYLIADGSDQQNYLRLSSEKNEFTSFKCTYAAGSSTIVAQGNNTNRTMSLSGKYFSCYSEVQPNGAVNIYKKETEKRITITFNHNEANIVDTVKKVKLNDKVQLPVPMQRGLQFDGWFTEPNGGTQITSLVATEDMTLYAHWTKLQSFNVTFVKNNGERSSVVKAYKGEVLHKNFIPNITKFGFKFMGWYLDNETFVNKWDEKSQVNGDLTLYAKWVPASTDDAKALEEIKNARSLVSVYDGTNKIYLTVDLNNANLIGTTDPTQAAQISVITLNEKNYLTVSTIYGEYFIAYTNNFIYASQFDHNYSFELACLNGEFKITCRLPEANSQVLHLEYSSNNNMFMLDSQSNGDKFNIEKVANSEITDVKAHLFQTLSTGGGLKVAYDSKRVATDVDLRFGAMFSKELFDPEAKYYVIIMETPFEFDTIDELLASGHAKECAPVRVDDRGKASETGDYYQFGWVIDNMEEPDGTNHYLTLLTSCLATQKNGVLNLSQGGQSSVEELVNIYLNYPPLKELHDVLETIKLH